MLQALIERSGIALSAGFYTPEQAAAITRHVYGVDTQLIEDGTYFVIEAANAGDCAGVAACGGWSFRRTLYGGDKMKSGADPLLDPATEPARIRAFFVDPAYARQGLGRRLLAACIEAARAAGFAEMELVSTLPGEPLYRAEGFDIVEPFALDLPGVRVPVSLMRRRIAARP